MDQTILETNPNYKVVDSIFKKMKRDTYFI